MVELKNKSVKREMKGKEGEKPTPMLSKKAPLVAGLVAATALALGACSARDEKPVENKKGVLVAETKPETKKAEVPVETKTVTKTMKEGDDMLLAEAGPASIYLKVIKINEKGVEVALGIETAFEEGAYLTHPGVTVPYGKSVKTGEDPIGVKGLITEIKAEKGKKPSEAVVTVKTNVPKEAETPETDAEVFLRDFGGPEKWCEGNIPEDCIPTKSNSVKEKFVKGDTLVICDVITNIVDVNENGIKIDVVGLDDLESAVLFDGPAFEIPYGKLADNLELKEHEIKKSKKPGEAMITTTYYDCWGTDKASYKVTVKEGDNLPIAVGTSFRAMWSPKVTKIDESGVEIVWKIESSFEKAGFMDFSMKIPYGESRKTGEGALPWEIKALKGKNPGEAVVTVKYPVSE